MKPHVKHISGAHITATDKRRAIQCLEYLARNQTFEERPPWLSVKGGKRYRLNTTDTPGEYILEMFNRYKNDYGAIRENLIKARILIVGTKSAAPKPAKVVARQLALF